MPTTNTTAQRHADAEARYEREAETKAHYQSEFAFEHGIAHLPREVADMVFAAAYEEGHSSGWTEVGYHYETYAKIALAAYEAGRNA